MESVRMQRLHRTQRVYEHAASSYRRSRLLWMKAAGAAGEGKMLSDLASTLRPGARVLDAGSGTGALSRQVKIICPDAQLTMADLSPAMLDQARDVEASRVVADVQRLPFRDGSFDVVVSSWVIETVRQPEQAVSEYLRVLTPEGRVFYTFCSRPESRATWLWSLPLRAIVRVGFAGHFLSREQTPWHACGRSHQFRFGGGLTTEIALAKCCTIDTTGRRGQAARAGLWPTRRGSG